MSNPFNYKSPLAIDIKRFLEIKESMGFNVLRTKWILKEIDDFANSYGIAEARITRDLIESWRVTRTNDSPRTIYAKYSVWSQLACFMNRSGNDCFVPRMPKQPKNDFTPYIFTHTQITELFESCNHMEVDDAHMKVALFAMPAILRLLYSTGLRVSEALSIRNKDVNLPEQYIIIRKTKNGSERIAPICESMSAVLRQYESFRNRMPLSGVALPNSLYFIKPDGTGIGSQSVYTRFRAMQKECGIPYIGDHHGPRVHDIRHTYACHALLQMSRTGKDLYAALPILSCSLGHHSIAATEQYVRLTSAMYPELEAQSSKINAYVFPKMMASNGDYGCGH